MSAPGNGQVMVEVALAAAGVLVIAFVSARVANWMNQSMVNRNASFQATRASATSGLGLHRPTPPGDIHLIGPGSNRAGGSGTQGSGPSASVPACSSAGQGAQNLATAARQVAQNCWNHGDAIRVPLDTSLAQNRGLVEGANNLKRMRLEICQCDAEAQNLAASLWVCGATCSNCNDNLRDPACTDCTNCRGACTGLCNTARTNAYNACSDFFCGGNPVCAVCAPYADGVRADCMRVCSPGCDPICTSCDTLTNITCPNLCDDCPPIQTDLTNKQTECYFRRVARQNACNALPDGPRPTADCGGSCGPYCGGSGFPPCNLSSPSTCPNTATIEPYACGRVTRCNNPEQSIVDYAQCKADLAKTLIRQAYADADCVRREIGKAEGFERNAFRDCAKK